MTKKIRMFLVFITMMILSSQLFGIDFNVSSEPDLVDAISKAKAGDRILIAEGEYVASRIYQFRQNGTSQNPIVVRGAGMRKTIIYGKNGKGIRLFGDYIILEQLTLTGGGDPLEIAGNHNIVRWVSSENSNIGVKVSGEHNTLEDLFIFSNEKTGIEVNAGFIYVPGWSDFGIRIRQALGQVPNFTPERNASERAKWNADQLAFFQEKWGHRDLDLIIRRVFLYENGYNRYENTYPNGWLYGQALYGGGIKCVPNVGGTTIDSVFVWKTGFSGIWFDEPGAPDNHVRNSIVIESQHGVHYEIGLHPEEHHAYIKNNVFWNVHQGFFNSASAENYYENNIINAGRYGMVNHGIKGNRTGRKTVSHFNHNKVYLSGFNYNRVGVDDYLQPKGHLVWFIGDNSIGSTRSGNTYYTTDSFPEVKISNAKDEGYSFAPGSLGAIGASESSVRISKVPDLILPSWPLKLPFFTEYFDRTDITFGDSSIVVIPPDSIIVDPPDSIVVPPPIGTEDRPRVILINDFAPTRVDRDCEPTSAFFALNHDRFNLTEIVAGHKWDLPGSLAYYNQVIGTAYAAERNNLDAVYGNFPESLDVLEASTNGIGFIDNVKPEDLEGTNPKYPSIKRIIGILENSDQVVNIFSGGTISEAATAAKYIISYRPELSTKVRFFSHGVLSGLVNYDRDKAAAQFMTQAASQGKIKWFRTGQSGMNFIDDRAAPNMPESIFDSRIGAIFLKKAFDTKSDFSDAIMGLLFMKELGGGESFIATLDSTGVNNGPKIESRFKGKKNILYEFIGDKTAAAINGDVNPCTDCGNPDPDPDPTSCDPAKIAKIEQQIEIMEAALNIIKATLQDLK